MQERTGTNPVVIGGAARGRSWLMAGAIVVVALACYWPALRAGFVWDDSAHVTRPELRSWSGLWRIWTDVQATQQYYPVLHTAFWFEHRLWGDAAAGYHWVNVLLHATSACLLALVLRRLWCSRPAGGSGAVDAWPPGAEWLAALLFLVHPVAVESVAWISEQKNTLSLTLYLLSALAYLRFAAKRTAAPYAIALVLYALALGAKTVTATLPAALLVMVWWQRGRLSWRRDVLPLAPWFLIGVAAGLTTAWVERTVVGAEGGRFDLPAGQRVLLAGQAIWFYLGKLLWPVNLSFVYPRWDLAAHAARGWASVAAVLAVTALLWRLRGRFRAPLAGWLLFGGSLFPALGFFNVYPFRYSFVADHFQYLASAGVIALAGFAAAAALARMPPPARAAGWTVCLLGLAGLGFLAHRQSRIYRDEETLYRATLQRDPGSWFAENNLGFLLAHQPGRLNEAIGHYLRALELKPDEAKFHLNLANALAAIPGRMPEALTHYRRALELRPDDAEAYVHLGDALGTIPGRAAEAIASYERALRLDPAQIGAQVNLANLLATLPGRRTEALPHYAAALQLQPRVAQIHYNLANTLAMLPGRMPDAVAEYQEALALQPDFADACVNLANALATMPDRLPEALAWYEQALRINPASAPVHYLLAERLSTVPGREADVIAHLEAAVRLDPSFVEAHNSLAIAYAQHGRPDEARRHWRRALELNPGFSDARRNLELLDSMGTR